MSGETLRPDSNTSCERDIWRQSTAHITEVIRICLLVKVWKNEKDLNQLPTSSSSTASL